MIDWRRLITAVIGGLVVTTAVFADMTPLPQLVVERQESLRVCSRTDLQYENLSSPYISPCISDLGFWPVQFSPEAVAEVGQTSDTYSD